MTLENICKVSRHVFVSNGHAELLRVDYIRAMKSSPVDFVARLSSCDEKNPALSDISIIIKELRVINPLPLLYDLARDKVGKDFVFTCVHVPQFPGAPFAPFGVAKKFEPNDYEVRVKFTNICWYRFLACKELMHVYADVFDNSQLEITALQHCVRSMHNVFPAVQTNLSAEATAFYLAVELLLPWRLRKQVERMIELKQTPYQIAKAFMVPEYVVIHILTNGNKNYLQLSRSINEALDNAGEPK